MGKKEGKRFARIKKDLRRTLLLDFPNWCRMTADIDSTGAGSNGRISVLLLNAVAFSLCVSFWGVPEGIE